MTDFAEYPLTMAHPHYVPAKSVPVPGTERFGPTGQLIGQDYRGTPEKFPPVTVGTADEEAYYGAQGYARAGKMDPSAYAKAHADSPPDTYIPQKYPLWRDGALIQRPEDDPEATEADFERPVIIQRAPEPAPTVAPETQNLAAQMADMQAQMQQMFATNQALSARLAAAEAKAEQVPEPVRRAPGRPRKVPEAA